MSRARILMLSLLAVVVLASGAMALAQTNRPAGPSGRYVSVVPPQTTEVGTTFVNFLWVLDTQTGIVKGYRFQAVNEGGTTVGWSVAELPPAKN